MTEEQAWEATEREIIDDDGSVEAFCPERAAGGNDPGVPYGAPPRGP